jgi:hypothetical protein
MTVDHHAPKRAYRKPTLQVIGSMQDITANVTDNMPILDGGAYPNDTDVVS